MGLWLVLEDHYENDGRVLPIIHTKNPRRKSKKVRKVWFGSASPSVIEALAHNDAFRLDLEDLIEVAFIMGRETQNKHPKMPL